MSEVSDPAAIPFQGGHHVLSRAHLNAQNGGPRKEAKPHPSSKRCLGGRDRRRGGQGGGHKTRDK